MRKFPNAFVILLGVILLSWVFTYLIPQGSYERIVDAETGVIRVVSDSYTQIDSSSPTFLDFLVSTPKGIAERAELIVLILWKSSVHPRVKTNQSIKRFCLLRY